MKAAIVTLTSIVATAAVALVACSTASARHAPSYADRQPVPVGLDDLHDARLGPKYVTLPAAREPVPAAPVVRVAAGDAFDWTDALLGAGVAAAAIALAAAATLLVARRHPHPHLPSHV